MAFVRERTKRDGATVYGVTYRIGGRAGRQSSVTFQDRKEADRFCALVDAFGPVEALAKAGISDTRPAMSLLTVTEFLGQHIDSLSGVERKTLTEYRRYVRNDIGPALGALPLSKLTRADVAGWVNVMQEAGAKTGTMQNKHGFLSGALKQAVKDGLLAVNPCDGVKLPRTEERETVFLTRDEFQTLKASFTEHYQPLVEFLVASGCRFNEAAALKPSDVNRTDNTVRIARAWKQDGTHYTMGPPKTQKSNRTINVPEAVLDRLDYSHEWLFTTTRGEPIRLSSWRTNVWNKSRARAQAADPQSTEKSVLLKSPTPHDLRHTCASWMIQAGVPLPVIQAHLGHESITTTVDRYGHLDRTSHVAAADAISKMLLG
nr:site-specific integrase [Mycobacterium sp. shizuoka-1]